MTTLQILTAAYAEIFGIAVNENGDYHDQKTGSSTIDYAHFGNFSIDYDIDADYIEAVTEDGCEGCYVGILRVRFNQKKGAYVRERIGTIKTLDEGRAAWRDMGALAGELAYVARETAWKLYRAERQAQQGKEA